MKFWTDMNERIGVKTDDKILIGNSDTGATEYTTLKKIKDFFKGGAVSVSGVSLNPSSGSIATGQTLQLTATVSPLNATDKSVTWQSSNTGVATVNSSGLVTAVSAGNVTITVRTTDGNYTATCTLVIVPTSIAVTGMSLTPETAFLSVGETLQLTTLITPTNATNKAINWSSSDAGIVSVNSTGRITAISGGVATITATTLDGNYSDTCTVTVESNIYVFEFVTSGPENLPPEANNNYRVQINSKKNGSVTDYSVKSNTGASWLIPTGQSHGIGAAQLFEVLANTTGSVRTATVVWIQDESGLEISKVFTQQSNTPVTSVKIVDVQDSYHLNNSVWLDYKVEITPANATNKVVNWTVSDATVGYIDTDGNNYKWLRFLKQGSITLTVTTQDGSYTAQKGITVTETYHPVGNIDVTDTLSIEKGQTKNATISVSPPNASDLGFTWQSSDPTIANGEEIIYLSGVPMLKIKAHKAGNCVITVTSDDNPAATDTCAVTVTFSGIALTSIALNPNTTTLDKGLTKQLAIVYTPANATIRTGTWSSSNTNIATVNASGLVTAVNTGSAIIKFTSDDASIEGTCAVTVKADFEFSSGGTNHVERVANYLPGTFDIPITSTADGAASPYHVDSKSDWITVTNISGGVRLTYTSFNTPGETRNGFVKLEQDATLKTINIEIFQSGDQSGISYFFDANGLTTINLALSPAGGGFWLNVHSEKDGEYAGYADPTYPAYIRPIYGDKVEAVDGKSTDKDHWLYDAQPAGTTGYFDLVQFGSGKVVKVNYTYNNYTFNSNGETQVIQRVSGKANTYTIPFISTNNGSDLAYTVQSDSTGNVVQSITKSGNSLIVTTKNNLFNAEQRGEITYKQNSSNLIFSIKFIQAPTTPENYVFNSGGNTSISGNSDGNSKAFVIPVVSTLYGAATDWNVISNQAWVEIIKSAGSFSATTTMFNSPGNTRTAIITATQAGSGNTIVLTITQTGDNVLPYDPNSIYLMHMDSTPLVDNGGYSNTVVDGGVQLTAGKFGNAVNFYDNGKIVSLNKQKYLDLLTSGTFTIDFWMNNRYNWNTGLFSWQSAPEIGSLNFQISGKVAFYINTGLAKIESSATIPLNVWTHVAVVCNNKAVTIYVNGVSSATGTLDNATLPSGYELWIGGTCYMDELRLSKIARWTANFTPPTNPY